MIDHSLPRAYIICLVASACSALIFGTFVIIPFTHEISVMNWFVALVSFLESMGLLATVITACVEYKRLCRTTEQELIAHAKELNQ